jgi:hypothetical protein
VCWTNGEDELSGTGAHYVAQLLQTLIAEAVVLLDNFTIAAKKSLPRFNDDLRVQINLILIQKREKCPLLDLMKIQ